MKRKESEKNMIITESVEVTRTEQVIVGRLCNKCGNVFSSHAENIKTSNTDLGEYGNCKSEICDDCWIEFIKTFSIVPSGFKSNPQFTSSFDLDHDLHQKLFVEWQETNVWNCDENPWRDYYENYDELISEEENCEEYEEFYDAIEDRKPLHTNVLRLVK